jgi:hypothetical protein
MCVCMQYVLQVHLIKQCLFPNILKMLLSPLRGYLGIIQNVGLGCIDVIAVEELYTTGLWKVIQ